MNQKKQFEWVENDPDELTDQKSVFENAADDTVTEEPKANSVDSKLVRAMYVWVLSRL
jgi:hypothetical protein